MSSAVKIILVAAFAVFVIGFIWAIVTAVKRPETKTHVAKDEITEPVAPAPVVGEEPAPVAEAPAGEPSKSGSASTPAPKQRLVTITKYVTVTTYQSSFSHSSAGGAWASAGVDASGNAWAEAYAN
jgi:hypothetical protein